MHRTRALVSFCTPLLLAGTALSACGPDSRDELDSEDLESAPERGPALPPWMDAAAFELDHEGAVDEFVEPERADAGKSLPRPDDGRDYLLANGPAGPAWIPYFERDGWLWAAEDMGLGPASMLQERSAEAGAVGLRWPYALVNYAFEDGMGISQQIAVEDALAKLSAASPLRFVENENPTKKITFVCWENKFGASNGIGMQVDGQTIKIP